MNDKKITKLHFGFANLETVTIPFKYVALLDMNHISEYMFVVGGDVLVQRKQAEEVMVILFPKAKEHAVSSFDVPSASKDIFDRILLFNDITTIDLEEEDGTMQEYSVMWEEGKNEEDNLLQKVFYQNNEHCCGFGGLAIHVGTRNSYPDMLRTGTPFPVLTETTEKSESVKLSGLPLSFLQDKLGKELYEFTVTGNTLAIVTPFLQPNGDHIRLYVIEKSDTLLTVTDDGEINRGYRLGGKEFDLFGWRGLLDAEDIRYKKDTDGYYKFTTNCSKNQPQLLLERVIQMLQLEIAFFGDLERMYED